MLLEFGENLATNNLLRSQTFNASDSSVQTVAALQPPSTEDNENDIISRNTVFEPDSGMFVAFIANSVKRDTLRDLLLQHAGAQGLTCKLEGKATVKTASSTLSVVMKIGYNDKNERMVHCHNEVSL